MKTFILGEFKDTGYNDINLEAVIKDWSHLWSISKYHEEYRLLKQYRKDSTERRKVKLSIKKEQAEDLIRILRLDEEKSVLFRNASTFRSSS